MPSAVGYQPTLASEMGAMQERITSTKTGSITSVQAVYVPADDLTDPEAYGMIVQPSPITVSASTKANGCMVTFSPILAEGSTKAKGLIIV